MKARPPSRGRVRNLGPVAGTGAHGAIPGIGAADLGEVVPLPDGSYVAVFGDCFGGNKVGTHPHYASVAVPVAFDEIGHPHFGQPLSGPEGSSNPLFIPPPQAAGKNTLPAGSILCGGTTYMMAVGTTDLTPDGGSWLVKVTDDPAKGWQPLAGSWRPWQPGDARRAPTQISGYAAADGAVYVAANAFDRSEEVTLYRTQPHTVTDRSTWRPYVRSRKETGGWGSPGQSAAPISDGQIFGEICLREIDGRVVLSGFNATTGNVEVRVSDDPTKLFRHAAVTTIVDHDVTPQPYGGFILPGSTLNKMDIFASQWNTLVDADGVAVGAPYNTQRIIANVSR